MISIRAAACAAGTLAKIAIRRTRATDAKKDMFKAAILARDPQGPFRQRGRANAR